MGHKEGYYTTKEVREYYKHNNLTEGDFILNARDKNLDDENISYLVQKIFHPTQRDLDVESSPFCLGSCS